MTTHQEPPHKQLHETPTDVAAFAPQLRVILRAKNQLMVCFLTFPLYVYGIIELLYSGKDITLLMAVYMVIYAVFGINCSVKRCPRCRQAFFVKKTFLQPFRRECAHCRLPLALARHAA